MSAFSANRQENHQENRRRILSLWLPHLPIDRIKRKFTVSSERREATNSALPLPLAGEGRGGGAAASHTVRVERTSSTLQAVEVRQEPPHVVISKQNNALVIYALDDVAARSGLSIGLPLANARAICPELTVFDAQLVRNRHGPVGRWIMEWKCDECLFSEPAREQTAHSQPVAATPAHRPHQAQVYELQRRAG